MHQKYTTHSPSILGEVKASPSEMCFVMYMPIHMPYCGLQLPSNLQWCKGIIDICMEDISRTDYIYLTAKYLYVNTHNMGNRKGWHIDGYGSADVNYVWHDAHPTEFCCQEFKLDDDHDASMRQMHEQAREENIRTYANNTVLRLDNTIVHRVNESQFEGMRTFVKISTSKHHYNLEGNAKNPLIDYDWKMYKRETVRNHPFVIEKE